MSPKSMRFERIGYLMRVGHEASPPDPVPLPLDDSEPLGDALHDGGGEQASAVEAPPSGASSYAGPGVMLSVDQKRAQLSDAVQVEYRARLEPIPMRKGDLTAERVYLTSLPERDEAQMARINEIDAEYNALMNRERDLSGWLATMLAALISRPAGELDAFDPAYGWPT